MIPKDPVMLLSYVNTQLRDNYASLDEFCGAMDVEKEELLSALGKIQYVYNPETNQFL
ncbi:MAG: DUF4250 domain-containing protein [Lachnospiraceae bacterium]|jgi:hypothetical protein|nr:DUF4250 domain-containing protein [Lachnospiraceae bacterium]